MCRSIAETGGWQLRAKAAETGRLAPYPSGGRRTAAWGASVREAAGAAESTVTVDPALDQPGAVWMRKARTSNAAVAGPKWGAPPWRSVHVEGVTPTSQRRSGQRLDDPVLVALQPADVAGHSPARLAG